MKWFYLTLFFLMTSCASYVQSIHNQIDREERANSMSHKKQPRRYDPYHAYRGTPMRRNDARPIQNPVTLGGYSGPRNNPPAVKREYNSGDKRVRAEDLVDSKTEGSLWSEKNSESFLFVTNNVKKSGDIVIIEVLGKLKEDIQAELKRTFPERPAPASAKKDDKKEEDKAKETSEQPAATVANIEDQKKIYDKISTQVIESINKDYLLVRGRKEVLFQKAKRFIEIQALVSQKDISDNDTVESDKILEPKITVLRY